MTEEFDCAAAHEIGSSIMARKRLRVFEGITTKKVSKKQGGSCEMPTLSLKVQAC